MKLKQFQRYLQQQKIDLVWLQTPDPHILYFTQQSFDPALLFVTKRTAKLYVSALDKPKKCEGITLRELSKDWQKEVRLNRRCRVGINKESLTVASKERLRKMFPKATYIDVSEQLMGLREKKVASEVKKITKACQITDNALTAFIRAYHKKDFKTEQDVALFLEAEIRKQGGEIAFPTIVASGKNAAVPHHHTKTAPLRRGFLLLDFGASFQQYNADMTRMLFIGKPTEAEKKMYSLLLHAQENAIDMVHESKTYVDLDTIARKTLGKYSQNFTHALGHGIGVEVHEGPRGGTPKISKGHVFTIEPGVYFPGKYGLRIEDTIFFDGAVTILTKSSKKLICL